MEAMQLKGVKGVKGAVLAPSVRPTWLNLKTAAGLSLLPQLASLVLSIVMMRYYDASCFWPVHLNAHE